MDNALDTCGPLDRLIQTNDEFELWWDSSPLVLQRWKEDFIRSIAAPAERTSIARQLDRLLVGERPHHSVLKGATTNPPLCLQAVEAAPADWSHWLGDYRQQPRGIDDAQAAWAMYCEVVRRGAMMLMPLFEASYGRHGFISAQVDPRLLHDRDAMVAQARALHAILPNVMIKMPGTHAGIEGIEALTALGIPTNATLTFTLSQLVAVADAVRRGLRVARVSGVSLDGWRSVVTMMLGRFEDCAAFRRQAESAGIELTEDLLRWAGVAVFKRAYRIFEERGYESKLLAASLRTGPVADGQMRVRHAEELAGGDLVLTAFPNILEAYCLSYRHERPRSRIADPVPAEVLETLLEIPYFRQAHEPNALRPEEFHAHPAVVETAEAFIRAAEQLEEFARHRSA